MPPATASNCLHANAAVQALMRLGNANLFQVSQFSSNQNALSANVHIRRVVCSCSKMAGYGMVCRLKHGT